MSWPSIPSPARRWCSSACWRLTPPRQPLHQPYRISHAGFPVAFRCGAFRWSLPVCDSCRHVAVPHLAPTATSPRPLLLHAAGRRGDEAGRIGCLRVGIALFPRALILGFRSSASARGAMSSPCLRCGIVYGALVALAQTDFKFVIGYSSVSHMGLCCSPHDFESNRNDRAVLQMFLTASSRDCSRHRRPHRLRPHPHRQLAELNMHLSSRLPFAAWAFVIADGLDGAARLFRLRCRVAGARWGVKVNPWWVWHRASASSSAWLIRGAPCKRPSLAMRRPAALLGRSRGTRWSHHLA